MKTLSTLLLAGVLAMPAFAQAPAPKPAAPAPDKGPAAIASLSAADAVLTAPFVLKDGAISQPSQTEIQGAGKAVFTFQVAAAGKYVIHAMVNAPAEDANSFYLSIDAAAEDPLMIWDMEVTSGFESRIVSWRGNGSAEADEFAPKVFTLGAGEHKLIVLGREAGAFLKSLSVRPAAK